MLFLATAIAILPERSSLAVISKNFEKIKIVKSSFLCSLDEHEI